MTRLLAGSVLIAVCAAATGSAQIQSKITLPPNGDNQIENWEIVLRNVPAAQRGSAPVFAPLQAADHHS